MTPAKKRKLRQKIKARDRFPEGSRPWHRANEEIVRIQAGINYKETT